MNSGVNVWDVLKFIDEEYHVPVLKGIDIHTQLKLSQIIIGLDVNKRHVPHTASAIKSGRIQIQHGSEYASNYVTQDSLEFVDNFKE